MLKKDLIAEIQKKRDEHNNNPDCDKLVTNDNQLRKLTINELKTLLDHINECLPVKNQESESESESETEPEQSQEQEPKTISMFSRISINKILLVATISYFIYDTLKK